MRQRKALGLTQEQLANQCSVSKQLISKIEKGHSIVNLDLLLKLINLLNIDFEEISNLFFEIPLKVNKNQKYLIDKAKASSFLTKEKVKTISDFIDLLKKGKMNKKITKVLLLLSLITSPILQNCNHQHDDSCGYN